MGDRGRNQTKEKEEVYAMKTEFLENIFGKGVLKQLEARARITDVKITHLRNMSNRRVIKARGGRTIVTVQIGSRWFTGQADCSISDNYCKKAGRRLAALRACRLFWEIKK